ncbi:MAG: hypothetical protein WC943_15145, partial [Elusimicrobiota bacterium]
MKHGVLLAEFVTSDLFPGMFEDSLPFFKGFLNRHGIPNRWLRFAVSADNPFCHGRDEVTLDEDAFCRLLRAAERLRARTAVFTHPLFGRQRRCLERAVPGLRCWTWRDGRLSTPDLLTRLGLPLGPGGFRHEDMLRDPDAHADYRWEPGNPAASLLGRDVVYLYTGADCAYRRPVAGNPCYAGISFPASVHGFGCAFCGDREVRPAPPPAVSASWVERQIRDLASAMSSRRPQAALVLPDIGNAGLLSAVIRAMRRSGMRRTPLLIGARLDHLLRVRPALERIIAGMRAGEAVHCITAGAENFVYDELLRFNKGFDPLTAIRGVNLLKELEAAHGGRFHYSGYRPLAVILLTPWTKPSDLAYNLRIIQHLGIEEEA